MSEVEHVLPAASEEPVARWDSFAGLSESEFMTRQRYLENSGRGVTHIASIASRINQPNLTSSANIHTFVQQQRKIISCFRSQPWSMQMKAAALMAYSSNVSRYAHQMNTFDVLRDGGKQLLYKLAFTWKVILQYITIWNSIIKRIEGRFGSSVASFFKFLRWVCVLNLVVTMMVIGLIIVPQAIGGQGLQVPESVNVNGSAFSFIFDAKGYVFEYSVLFYGYYDSGQNEPYLAPPNNPDPYIRFNFRLPLAYLLVMVSVFIFCAVAILVNMAEKYKVLQRANVSEQYLVSWKVFASWDHTITNADTALRKQRHITISLKETLVEAKKREDKGINWLFLLIRILSHSFVVILLIASSYAIFLAVENLQTHGATSTDISAAIQQGWMGIWLFIQSFQVQAVVIIRNAVLHYTFFFCQIIERYHPRTALKIMLFRMFVLYTSSLYVLIIALFALSDNCNSGIGNSTNSSSSFFSMFQFKNTIKNSSSNATTSGLTQNGDLCCWETQIGQELYKLTLSYFGTELVTIALTDCLRWALVRSKIWSWFNKMFGYAEFSLAENVLKLVYGQSLVWLGMLFCPILPAINLAKCVIIFYIRVVVILLFNKPPSILFRVDSTRNFYMGLLLLTVFLCIFPVGYAIVVMTPSQTCGPFRGLASMLTILTNEIAIWPAALRTIVGYLQTPTIIVPLICTICIVAYYYATLATALKEVNKDLQLQLHIEQKEIKERIVRSALDPSPPPPSHRHFPPPFHRHEQINIHNEELIEEEDSFGPPPPSPSPLFFEHHPQHVQTSQPHSPQHDSYHEHSHDPYSEHLPQHSPYSEHLSQHDPYPEHPPQHDPYPEHLSQHDPYPEHLSQHDPYPEHLSQHDPYPEHPPQHDPYPEQGEHPPQHVPHPYPEHPPQHIHPLHPHWREVNRVPYSSHSMETDWSSSGHYYDVDDEI